jgi:hypothetical protein
MAGRQNNQLDAWLNKKKSVDNGWVTPQQPSRNGAIPDKN